MVARCGSLQDSVQESAPRTLRARPSGGTRGVEGAKPPAVCFSAEGGGLPPGIPQMPTKTPMAFFKGILGGLGRGAPWGGPQTLKTGVLPVSIFTIGARGRKRDDVGLDRSTTTDAVTRWLLRDSLEFQNTRDWCETLTGSTTCRSHACKIDTGDTFGDLRA